MLNLVYHRQDFALEAAWTFSGSGHGKGPGDGLGAVVKCAARKHQLKEGPEAAFSSPKDFYKFTLEKCNRTVSPSTSIRRRKQSTKSIDDEINDSTDEEVIEIVSDSTRSIEVRWLDAEDVKETFEKVLKTRWSRLSSKGIFHIQSDAFIFLARYRPYRGYSKLPRIRCNASWHDRLSFCLELHQFEDFCLQAR
jgi:hypothetical protein